MKYKKGDIGVVAEIILVILIVAAIAFITLPSIKNSVTGIIEPIKKMLGFDEKKPEETAKAGDCVIKRYYWTEKKIKSGEFAPGIVVEGNEYCNGKKIQVFFYSDRSIGDDLLVRKYDSVEFKENVAKADLLNRLYLRPSLSGFYFIVEYNGNKMRSDNLEIVN